MDKYLRRPQSKVLPKESRYERYNLRENPFPASPFINPQSTDARSNGDIYEWAIRQVEYDIINRNFLGVAQSDPNHLRLGYIVDTSYIGRGNGKSAFLVNLQKRINRDFGDSESNGLNRCFALTVVPEPGGKTKTFEQFVHLFVKSIFESTIIDDCLASLRLEAIVNLASEFDVASNFSDEQELREKLGSYQWFQKQDLDVPMINDYVKGNRYLQNAPPDFPIGTIGLFDSRVTTKADFVDYYQNLKRGKPRFEFVFTDLVNLFLAGGFNGAYIFVDDFERIPDFQSERQKRDFALELRTCLFDGMYQNPRIGFYVVFLVLHAGVPRLIQSAWDQSGLEQRSPIFVGGQAKHVVRFEKITQEDAFSLVSKYLAAYRIQATPERDYSPFSRDAVKRITELSEFNASKILKLAYEVLERAVDEGIAAITEDFVSSSSNSEQSEEQRDNSGIHNAPTKNMMQESE
jgi:hypothetical protein